jgi:hypothetical protein
MHTAASHHLPLRLLIVAALIFFLALSPDLQARQQFCPESRISVRYHDNSDYELVCLALNRLSDRLTRMGMDTDIATTVHIKRRIDYRNFADAPPMRVYGIYEREADEIHLSQWSGTASQDNPRTVLGLTADRTLHLSVIIHELSHAFIHRNATVKLSNTAQEFWAYVLQIDLLPETYRRQVLALHGGEFEDLYEINSLQHAADPTAFGIKAYRWYRAKGEALMRQMLNGEFQPDQLIEQLSH